MEIKEYFYTNSFRYIPNIDIFQNPNDREKSVNFLRLGYTSYNNCLGNPL